jgi:hypothetical protein
VLYVEKETGRQKYAGHVVKKGETGDSYILFIQKPNGKC